MKNLNNKFWYSTTQKACHKIGASPSSLQLFFCSAFSTINDKKLLSSGSSSAVLKSKIKSTSGPTKGLPSSKYSTRSNSILTQDLENTVGGLDNSHKFLVEGCFNLINRILNEQAFEPGVTQIKIEKAVLNAIQE
jgi:hypothetical protein